MQTCSAMLSLVETDSMDGVREVRALDVFHGEKEVPLRRRAKVVDGDDVRVVQLGHRPRLAAETVGEVFVHADLQGQELDGDEPIQLDLPRLVHRAHAAATEHPEHFVLRKKARDFRVARRRPLARATTRHLHRAHRAGEQLFGLVPANRRRQRCRSGARHIARAEQRGDLAVEVRGIRHGVADEGAQQLAMARTKIEDRLARPADRQAHAARGGGVTLVIPALEPREGRHFRKERLLPARRILRAHGFHREFQHRQRPAALQNIVRPALRFLLVTHLSPSGIYGHGRLALQGHALRRKLREPRWQPLAHAPAATVRGPRRRLCDPARESRERRRGCGFRIEFGAPPPGVGTIPIAPRQFAQRLPVIARRPRPAAQRSRRIGGRGVLSGVHRIRKRWRGKPQRPAGWPRMTQPTNKSRPRTENSGKVSPFRGSSSCRSSVPQPTMNRHSSLAIPAMLLALAGITLPSPAEPAQPPLKSEHFDRDPGWEGVNNRIVAEKPRTIAQDFGYSPKTNFAGGQAGEIGGRVARTSRLAFYAVKLPPRTLKDRFSASGAFTFTETAGTSGVCLGFFNDQQPETARPTNSLTMNFDTEGTGARLAVRLITAKNESCGQFVTHFIPGKFRPTPLRKGVRYEWKLDYNPDGAGGNGQFTYTLSGHDPKDPIDSPITVNLTPGFKEQGTTFNRFGIANMRKAGNTVAFYVDDLTVDGKKWDFATDPQWEGVGNRDSYAETDPPGAHSFGYSMTNFAGGNTGEIGGIVWRTTFASYADRVGHSRSTSRSSPKGAWPSPAPTRTRACTSAGSAARRRTTGPRNSATSSACRSKVRRASGTISCRGSRPRKAPRRPWKKVRSSAPTASRTRGASPTTPPRMKGAARSPSRSTRKR